MCVASRKKKPLPKDFNPPKTSKAGLEGVDVKTSMPVTTVGKVTVG